MYKLAKTLIGTVALTLLGGLANAQDTKNSPGSAALLHPQKSPPGISMYAQTSRVCLKGQGPRSRGRNFGRPSVQAVMACLVSPTKCSHRS